MLGAAGTGWPTRGVAGGVAAGGAPVVSGVVGAGAGTGAAVVATGVVPVAATASADFGPQPLKTTVAQATASAMRAKWVEEKVEFTMHLIWRAPRGRCAVIKMIADGSAAGHPTSATVGVGRC